MKRSLHPMVLWSKLSYPFSQPTLVLKQKDFRFLIALGCSVTIWGGVEIYEQRSKASEYREKYYNAKDLYRNYEKKYTDLLYDASHLRKAYDESQTKLHKMELQNAKISATNELLMQMKSPHTTVTNDLHTPKVNQ